MRNPNSECSGCEKPIYVRPSKRKKENWCGSCKRIPALRAAKKRNERVQREYVVRWLAGEEDGMSGKTSISMHIKRWLFAKYDSKCGECGWSEVNQHTGRIPLEVNHIDGNHTNNRPENLELICPSCHSLTSSYRALNKGKGRPRK